MFMAICASLKADDGLPIASSALRAAYVINIAKLTNFKEKANQQISGRFRLCVLGTDQLLVTSLKQKKDASIHGKPVEVLNFFDTRYLSQCNAVVIAPSERDYLHQIQPLLKGKPIPTISEIPGFVESGGMYELYIDEDRLSFKVNIACIEQSQLITDSRLLTLAGNRDNSRELECKP